MRTPFISRRVAARHQDDLHAEGVPVQLKAQNRVPRRVSMQKETPMAIEMPTIHRSRTAIAAFVTVLTFALSAPLAVNAQEQVIAEELVVAAEDTVPALAPIAVPAVTGTSGDGVRTTRAIAAERALLTGDIGSMQEEHLRAIVAAAPSWDETSGYGAVEATRATIGHPAASTTAEQTRLVAAQQALLSQDLGSLQEDALTAIVDASSVDAEASVDHAPAPTSAELLAQFRAIELSLSRYLGAD